VRAARRISLGSAEPHQVSACLQRAVGQQRGPPSKRVRDDHVISAQHELKPAEDRSGGAKKLVHLRASQ
jgi:hypothetical protein